MNVMSRYGYAGVGFLILIETVFPPIPSEVILTFGGFLTTCTDLHVYGMIGTATASSLLSAWLLYGLGRFLHPQKLQKIMSGRIGRLLGFSENEMEHTNSWFDKKGQTAVFYGRCIPILRSLISIPAGMAAMKPLPFTIYTTAGSLIWNTVLIVLGAAAGESWEIILHHMSAYEAVVKIGAATCAVTLILRKIQKKRRKNAGI